MATPTKTPPLPKTFTVNVPALGGLVTVQALTMAKIQALTPFPYDPVLHTWKIIEAATISPKWCIREIPDRIVVTQEVTICRSCWLSAN